MAGATELPQLVKEFTDMSKEYLLQETVEPARQLGRYAGFGMGAALSWALAVFFFALAGQRWIIELLPDSVYWSALGYLIAAVALAIVAAIIVGAAQDRSAGEDRSTAGKE